MHPERPALPHEAVEQQPGVLGDLVVLGEDLLELVDDQHRAREGFVLSGGFECVAGGPDGLHAQVAEQVAPADEFVVEALEDAEPEFAVGLDRDGAGVGEPAPGVGLELDALLEVHEVELELVGAIPQRPGRDHDVQQRGLARARFAGDQGVLAGAFAEREFLQTRRARPAQRDAEFIGARI